MLVKDVGFGKAQGMVREELWAIFQLQTLEIGSLQW